MLYVHTRCSPGPRRQLSQDNTMKFSVKTGTARGDKSWIKKSSVKRQFFWTGGMFRLSVAFCGISGRVKHKPDLMGGLMSPTGLTQ
jgi:hypothetical protein